MSAALLVVVQQLVGRLLFVGGNNFGMCRVRGRRICRMLEVMFNALALLCLKGTKNLDLLLVYVMNMTGRITYRS